jgi:hypothetical protein
MKIGRGNRRARRIPAPLPLCPPEIPHDLTPGSKPATNRLSYDSVSGLDQTHCLRILLEAVTDRLPVLRVGVRGQHAWCTDL